MTRTQNRSPGFRRLAFLSGFLLIGLACPPVLRLLLVSWDVSFWTAMLVGIAILAVSIGALDRGLESSLRWQAQVLFVVGAVTVTLWVWYGRGFTTVLAEYLRYRCHSGVIVACTEMRKSDLSEDRLLAATRLCEQRPNIIDCEKVVLADVPDRTTACSCLQDICAGASPPPSGCSSRSVGWRDRACDLRSKHCNTQ